MDERVREISYFLLRRHACFTSLSAHARVNAPFYPQIPPAQYTNRKAQIHVQDGTRSCVRSRPCPRSCVRPRPGTRSCPWPRPGTISCARPRPRLGRAQDLVLSCRHSCTRSRPRTRSCASCTREGESDTISLAFYMPKVR